MRVPTCFRRVLVGFTPVAVALLSSTAAHADYYYVPIMRLSGEWQTPWGKLVMKGESFEGAMSGMITDPATGKQLYAFWWDEYYDKGDRHAAEVHWMRVIDGKPTCRVFTISCSHGRIRMAVSQDGKSFTATRIDGQLLGEQEQWKATRGYNSTALERTHAWLFGKWDTSRGQLTLWPEGDIIVGRFQAKGANSPASEGLVALWPNGWGAWEMPNATSRQRGHVNINASKDTLAFTGSYSFNRSDDPSNKDPDIAWTGKKIVDGQSETPAPEEPGTGPAPQPLPEPPTGSEPGPGSGSGPTIPAIFKPLKRVDVRLDSVVEARGTPTRQVHAFVTVKNASPQPQYFTSGFLKVILTDADGVAQERNQPFRASGEPAALFASTPVIQPGGELKVRFVFMPDEGAQPATVTFSEGDKSAEFPVTGL